LAFLWRAFSGPVDAGQQVATTNQEENQLSRLRLRRPGPALIVSTVALVVALGGTSYAAFSLPNNSVGTKEIRNHAVTLSKVAASAQQALRGQAGPRGLTGAAGQPGQAGPPGPGAVKFHVDSTTATGFGEMALAHIGAWTLNANCSESGGTANLTLRAQGPADSVIDGLQNGGPYSDLGSNMAVGSGIAFPTSGGGGANGDDLTLYSPTGGGAHISVFSYATSNGSTLRCKVSGDAFTAS
jgi:hypothetical protein